MSLQTTETRRAVDLGGKHAAAASTRCKFLHYYRTLMQPHKLWMSKWVGHTHQRGKPPVSRRPSLCFRPTFSEHHAGFSITVNGPLRYRCLGSSAARLPFSKCDMCDLACKRMLSVSHVEIVHCHDTNAQKKNKINKIREQRERQRPSPSDGLLSHLINTRWNISQSFENEVRLKHTHWFHPQKVCYLKTSSVVAHQVDTRDRIKKKYFHSSVSCEEPKEKA